jgi:hypothetical protein
MRIIKAQHPDWQATPFFILTSGQYEHIMRGYEDFQNLDDVIDYLCSFECENTDFITTVDDQIVFKEMTENRQIEFWFDQN